MLTYFLWFSLGAIVSTAASAYFSLGVESLIIRKSLLMSGKLISALQADFEQVLKYKHDSLKISDIPDAVLKKIDKDDKLFLSQWKTTIFITVVGSIPKKYLRYVPQYVVLEDATLEETIEALKEEK